MDLMRKYCFASVLIFGEDDKNEITGFFVIRGSEMPDLMKDVPDFECYNWTKMDVEDKKQVELFNDYLAWEGELEGKTVNQGKTFK
jgi:elongation factor 1-gamma